MSIGFVCSFLSNSSTILSKFFLYGFVLVAFSHKLLPIMLKRLLDFYFFFYKFSISILLLITGMHVETNLIIPKVFTTKKDLGQPYPNYL